jgi:hypothetical protein
LENPRVGYVAVLGSSQDNHKGTENETFPPGKHTHPHTHKKKKTKKKKQKPKSCHHVEDTGCSHKA